MIILSCSNISISFGIKPVLENISFSIQEGEKVGFVGVNGAGKSTLFNLIAGNLKPDNGEIFIQRGVNPGYLHQNTGLDTQRTLWEEVLQAYSPLLEIEQKMKELEAQISSEKDESRLHSFAKAYSTLSEDYAAKGGYEYISRAKGILKGLGFSEDEFGRSISTLSGGQKTRLALARLLNENPDILMLDEPTNHLDMDAIEWLEGFLKDYKKALMVISHDRYFLDQVAGRIIEIENNSCTVYNGNYSNYVKLKEINREIQQKHYDNQQKEIQHMERFIEQQRRWNRERNIIAAESRLKAIERMEKVDKPQDLPDKISISFTPKVTSGNDVMYVEELAAYYPGKELFSHLNFLLRKGQKAFLLGPNGCGKTTLLKIMAGRRQPEAGSCRFGNKVVMGYYDQEQSDLDENSTIIDEVWNSNDQLGQTQVRNALAAFLFKADDILKPISVLSGGEKSRVSLLKLMLSAPNLLLLDEPTNHLDIQSREVLENSLIGYEGTIVAVSHDRYFINKMADRILEMTPAGLIDYCGGYQYYRERKAENNVSSSLDNSSKEKMSQSKEQRQKAKEEQAIQRKMERQLENLEQTIHRIEARIAEIQVEMSKEEIAAEHQKLCELHEESTSLAQELDELYKKWTEMMDQGI